MEPLVGGDKFAPREFAFLRFDLNDFKVEFEVLKFVMKRVVKGVVLLLTTFLRFRF